MAYEMINVRRISGLVASLGIVFCVAWIGGSFTNMSVLNWYPTLNKPAWTPSGSTIGLIWTILYSAMAIAAWVVWSNGGLLTQRRPLLAYAAQLILNAGWSFLFFGMRSPGLALVEIVVLWAAIVVTLVSFWKVSRVAGALMIPYLLWVSFAAFLNFMIWRLN